VLLKNIHRYQPENKRLLPMNILFCKKLVFVKGHMNQNIKSLDFELKIK